MVAVVKALQNIVSVVVNQRLIKSHKVTPWNLNTRWPNLIKTVSGWKWIEIYQRFLAIVFWSFFRYLWPKRLLGLQTYNLQILYFETPSYINLEFLRIYKYYWCGIKPSYYQIDIVRFWGEFPNSRNFTDLFGGGLGAVKVEMEARF